MRHLDRTDARILLALDDDSLSTVTALAARLHLARNTVQARLRNVEGDDCLAPVSVRVRPERLGYPVLAFITLAISQDHSERILAEIAEVPEVCEVHAITGDSDLLVRVAVRDNADLHRVTRILVDCTGVVRSSTAISMVECVPLRMAPLLHARAGERESGKP